MSRFLSSPWTWAITLVFLELVGLILVPTLIAKVILSGVLGVGSLLIMVGKRHKDLRFGLTVATILLIAAFLAAYINLSSWFPALKGGLFN